MDPKGAGAEQPSLDGAGRARRRAEELAGEGEKVGFFWAPLDLGQPWS